MLARVETVFNGERPRTFFERFILDHGFKSIADIGGGAQPLISPEFIATHALDYTVFDISQTELDLAPSAYSKVCADMQVPLSCTAKFDFVFSHCFLEHVTNPKGVHANVRSLLKPGGYSVHYYPTRTNLPLFANWLLPEFVTQQLIKLSKSWRKLNSGAGKFPAYYRWCGNPSRRLHRKFEKLGFEVVSHTGYVGHNYYKPFPILRDIERKMRPLIVAARIPATSGTLLVLRAAT